MRCPVPRASIVAVALFAAGLPVLEVAAQPANIAVIDALSAEPSGTAQRAAFYDEVARADLARLNALLDRAAALKEPATKSFALDALLGRYAELDPGGAVAAANKLGSSAVNPVPYYQTWLRSSPAAALASIAKLSESQASAIVPALLTRVEADQELVAEILAAVPRPVADRYIAYSVMRLGQNSPSEALERAQEISDPRVRADAINGILGTLASREPRKFLDYLATLDETTRRNATHSGFWYQIASSEPELALDRIDLFPPEAHGTITVTAVSAIARRDPVAAYARAQQMPQGQERRQAVQQIAQTFAQNDADGALAWARSLQPPEPEVLVGVVTAIGAKDPLRALDVAATIGTPMERQQAMQQIVSSTTLRDPGRSGALLDRVFSLPNEQERQSLVQSILSSWGFKEPAQAADWLVANADRVPLNAAATVASQYAQRNLEEAASYAARMPPAVRGSWMNGVARMYAQTNPRAALDWIQQFRGSAEYDDAALAVIAQASRVDPEAAAHAAESVGREEYRRNAINQAAIGWAQRDPARAAAWVSGIGDQGQQTVGIIASIWGQQDLPAAQAWVLSQPAGRGRDSALVSLITSSARNTIPDDALFAGLSDDRARLAAVQGAAMFISQRDATASRAFVEAHVADPAQRERMLSAVAQFPGIRGGIVDPVTGVVVGPPGVPMTVACSPASAAPCVRTGPMPPTIVMGGLPTLPPSFVPGQPLPQPLPQPQPGATTAPTPNTRR